MKFKLCPSIQTQGVLELSLNEAPGGHCRNASPSASLDGLRRYLGAWMSQVNPPLPLQGFQVTLVFGVAEALSGENS